MPQLEISGKINKIVWFFDDDWSDPSIVVMSLIVSNIKHGTIIQSVNRTWVETHLQKRNNTKWSGERNYGRRWAPSNRSHATLSTAVRDDSLDREHLFIG